MMTYSRFAVRNQICAVSMRDVLVALGLQRVHQVGPLEGHAAALGDLPELLELAVGQRAGVVEEPADQAWTCRGRRGRDDDRAARSWLHLGGKLMADHM